MKSMCVVLVLAACFGCDKLEVCLPWLPQPFCVPANEWPARSRECGDRVEGPCRVPSGDPGVCAPWPRNENPTTGVCVD